MDSWSIQKLLQHLHVWNYGSWQNVCCKIRFSNCIFLHKNTLLKFLKKCLTLVVSHNSPVFLLRVRAKKQCSLIIWHNNPLLKLKKWHNLEKIKPRRKWDASFSQHELFWWFPVFVTIGFEIFWKHHCNVSCVCVMCFLPVWSMKFRLWTNYLISAGFFFTV